MVFFRCHPGFAAPLLLVLFATRSLGVAAHLAWEDHCYHGASGVHHHHHSEAPTDPGLHADSLPSHGSAPHRGHHDSAVDAVPTETVSSKHQCHDSPQPHPHSAADHFQDLLVSRWKEMPALEPVVPPDSETLQDHREASLREHAPDSLTPSPRDCQGPEKARAPPAD